MTPEEWYAESERLRLMQMEMDLHVRQSQREVCFLCGEVDHSADCLLNQDHSP